MIDLVLPRCGYHCRNERYADHTNGLLWLLGIVTNKAGAAMVNPWWDEDFYRPIQMATVGLTPDCCSKKRAHSPLKPLALSASLITFRGLCFWLRLRFRLLWLQACLQALRSCLPRWMRDGLISRVCMERGHQSTPYKIYKIIKSLSSSP